MKKDVSDNGATTIRSSQKVILDFLDRDIAAHPERLQPVTGELVRPNNTWEPARSGKKKPQPRTVGVSLLVEPAGIEPASASPLQTDLHT